MRITKLFFLTMICQLTFSPSVVLARDRSLVHSDAAGVEKILKLLDDTVWVPDGKPSDKQVYIFSQSTCPFAKQLFDDTRPYTKKIQFRWIPQNTYGDSWVAESRTVKALAKAFSGDPGAPRDDTKASRMTHHNMSSGFIIAKMFGLRGLGSPVLVYKTKYGVKINTILQENIKKILAEVVARPEATKHVPAGIELVSPEVQIIQTPNLEEYANMIGPAIDIYSYPSRQAPVISTLERGYKYSVNGVTEDGFIAVQVFKDTPSSYIYDPALARCGLLNFEVEPTSGDFAPMHDEAKSYLLPCEDTNIFATLPKGKLWKITGRVKGHPWFQVQVLAGGTKGYVLMSEQRASK